MYFFSLRSNAVGQPTFVSHLLTPEECAAIISSTEGHLQIKAGRTEDHQLHEKLRKSDIGWLNPDGEHRWLFDRIKDCVNGVNADWFRYDLTGFEGVQFTKYSYKEGEADFYSSHRDTATLPGGTVRKLSFTIQLSDPDSYSGGDVLLYNSLIDSSALSRAIGSISFFPSYTIHEVIPVTRGVRYSLVGWACGPAFV
jgi:PKHD-type hydroxylase